MLDMLETIHTSERTTFLPPGNVDTFSFFDGKLEACIFLWMLTNQCIDQIRQTFLDITRQINHIIDELANQSKKIKIVEHFIVNLMSVKEANDFHHNTTPYARINFCNLERVFKLQTVPC